MPVADIESAPSGGIAKILTINVVRNVQWIKDQ